MGSERSGGVLLKRLVLTIWRGIKTFETELLREQRTALQEVVFSNRSFFHNVHF